MDAFPDTVSSYSTSKAGVKEPGTMLEREIDSHRCPICMELMLHPTYSPMMLVPCGHSFCARCMVKHHKGKGSMCPVCRSAIQMCVMNQSLKSIIEAYSKETTGAVVQFSSHIEEGLSAIENEETVQKVREYIQMYSLAEARCGVLAAELETAMSDLSKSKQQQIIDEKVATYLLQEKGELQEQISRMTQELEVVSQQLNERHESVADAIQTQNSLAQKIVQLQRSIDTISVDTLKAKTFISHLAPHIEL
eukprot:TRINITY_DN30357_c0_g1_i1.p1 TRINITY_DN30357_c0_g1~~TRINITY_DN30357_c0_g1_i1.p1  ORF type:complete len:250 (+),score=49.12 TRINITY_DN30357_c0_g1_i1:58-807(+)